MQDINLLPQSEIQEQTKVRAVKLSTLFSIIMLLAVMGFSGYILYLNNQSKTKIADLDAEIDAFRNEITSMSATEVTVRNLDKKYNALKTIFSVQKKYSLLIQEIRIRKPAELTVDSMDLKDGKLNINGSANNYIAIAQFINNLLNKNFEGGNAGLKEVFTAVSLNSVSMESSKNTIQYFIVVDFDSTKLR